MLEDGSPESRLLGVKKRMRRSCSTRSMTSLRVASSQNGFLRQRAEARIVAGMRRGLQRLIRSRDRGKKGRIEDGRWASSSVLRRRRLARMPSMAAAQREAARKWAVRT